MRALVLENESHKAQEIMDVLQSSGHQGSVFLCMEDAKNEIHKKKYDVIIVDLKIPQKHNQTEDTKYGIDFIQYIFDSVQTDFYRPQEVIVISGFLSNEIDLILRKYPVSVISYDSISKWIRTLQARLNQFVNYSCDVAIITAVDVEFAAFKKWKWESGSKIQDLVWYKKTIENAAGESIRLLLVKQEGMGMVPATAITSKVIEYFGPKCVIMAGICAGRKDAVTIGDIIVGVQAWDYGSGSLEEQGKKLKLIPAPDYIRIPQDIKMLLEREFTEDLLKNIKMRVKEIAKEEEKGTLLEIAKEQINVQNNIYFGAMASGAAVIKSEKFTNAFIKSQNRKYYGIDMETYGIYYAALHSYQLPHFFCVKAVTDVADIDKEGKYQEYCANVSALMIEHYIKYCFAI